MNIKHILIFILAGTSLVSCSRPKEEAPEDPKSFVMTDSMARMITLDTVVTRKVQSELKLTGKVSFNEEKVIRIYPLVTGTVREVKIELGDYVQKGQTLAVIQSAEVAGLEQERIGAEGAVLVAKKNLDATNDMYTAGISSAKDMIIAQKEYDRALAEQKRIRDIFRIYNINSAGEYVIKSPIAGFVVDKKVNSQMQIRADNNDNLFTISGLDEVWVTANVYESDIAKIREGYEADVSTLTFGDKVFKGKIDKVFNVLDPETKVMKIRVKLPNPGYELKPEMFASVIIRYNENQEMAVIPAASVVFDNSKNYVMVYHNNHDIETREVTPYKTVNSLTYISGGLKPGEQVITKYHLLVYDALND